jgi:hypothetical protein
VVHGLRDSRQPIGRTGGLLVTCVWRDGHISDDHDTDA